MFKTNDKVVLKAKTTVGGNKDMSGAKGVVAKVFDSLAAGALAIVMIDGVAYKIPVEALELAPVEPEICPGPADSAVHGDLLAEPSVSRKRSGADPAGTGLSLQRSGLYLLSGIFPRRMLHWAEL